MAKESKATKKRDRTVTRNIHKLFWRANFESKYLLIGAMAMRIPAIAFFHISIPLTIAYGVQAIVDRQFGAIPNYALQVVLFAIAYALLWGIGGIMICRNGVIAGSYLQKQVFANYLNKDYDFYSNNILWRLRCPSDPIARGA